GDPGSQQRPRGWQLSRPRRSGTWRHQPALRDVSARFTLRGSIFRWRGRAKRSIGSSEGISRPLRKDRSWDAPNEHRGLLGCLRRGDLAGIGRRRDSAFEARRRGRAKRYAPRMAKQRHQARHDALFPERRKRKIMTKRLEGKIAVITGGTEGIGLATAKLFAKEGAYVFITGRRPKQLDEAVKAIGSNATGVQGDVAKMADLDLLYETVGKVKGRVDIIFANAGVGEFVPFGDVSEGHFDKLLNINVKGAFFTVQKGLPLLNDGGSIILTGSVASVKGTAAFGVYAASKGAIGSFVRTWTTDLRERPIRSNVVSPGPINTPLVNRQSADVIARVVSTIPMGRMGEPVEVAKAALYLASDD